MLSDQITVTINNYYTFAAMTCEILLRLSPTYPLCIPCVCRLPVFVYPLCITITVNNYYTFAAMTCEIFLRLFPVFVYPLCITVTVNKYYTFAAMTCEIILRLSPVYPLCSSILCV